MNFSTKEFKKKMEDYLSSDTSGAKITKILLATIAIAALTGIAVTAPNIFTIFHKRKSYKDFPSRKYYNALTSLKRRGYIEKSLTGKISLTPKGNRQLKTILLEDINIIKPKKWDGKWRIFLFDIPIRFKKGRNALRFKIKDMGFIQLQKSVWIYPYPCEEEMNLVASFFGVTKFVDFLIVEKTTRDADLRKEFGL